MATNKNALLRYHTLDKCFSNPGKKYSIEDLLEKVNEALIYDNPHSKGIEMRQLREDIRILRNPPYDAPIETIRDGKSYYYTYSDSKFSITNAPLNKSEVAKLNETIKMLERFIGKENFSWLNELAPMLKDRLKIKDEQKKIISLETDQYNIGTGYISPIFNAISNKCVLHISFTPFGGEPIEFIFHPYHLKQYNNRWFALGRNEEQDSNHWVVPLDRISGLKEIKHEYFDYDFDWEEYFQDFIGVTKKETEPVEVILKFPKQQGHYVETKPIHSEQRASWQADGSLIVKMKLIPNFELESTILSFGDKVEVIEPTTLRNSIADRLKAAANLY